MKLNFGLIGCGRIAKKHIKLLAEGIPEANLVAVCDTVEERAQEYAERYEIDYYTDYEEMLRRDDIDVVHICTPSGLHPEMGINAALARKHVVVEKPMALSLTEADELINACKTEGVKLFVIKQNRLNTPVKIIRQALEEKRFGRLLTGNVTVRWSRPQSYYDQDEWHGTWMFDGGVLMNQASHHVDLLQWMMGEVESVKAYVATLNHNIETEDTAVAILKFKNGSIGVIEATTCVFQKNLEGSLTVLGEKGSAKIGGFAVNKMETWNFEDYSSDDEIHRSNSTNPPDVYGFGHLEYFQNVIGVLLNRAKPYTDGFEGRKSLELILAIYQSAITGEEVKLPLRKDSDIEKLMLRRRGVKA